MLSLITSFSSKIYLIVIASLITMLATLIVYTYFLSNDLEDSKKDLIQKELLYQVLVTDLEDVAKQIEKREEEFAKWKAKEPEIKYKTIVKFKEVIKNEKCDEKVKAISNINYSDL